ncbi:CoA transferase [SAR202 cluster bacterium AC-647-N09_OGT_505m]|nr:CoA transferase [SAR202 cluster bacterium AC-647-N09_OGT_505m]
MSGALNGIRVIDLGTVIAGPYCTMQLADLGAEVIKIEEPAAAERRSLPGGGLTYQPSDFIQVGSYRDRNKEAMSLNIRHPKGLEILLGLIQKADVVTENFSPGTMDRMGIGYDVLKAINPRIIYVSISAFGQTGSYKHHRGYDILAQARTGFASTTGFPTDPPTRAGNAITDYFAGLLGALSILAALRHVERTGRGQSIDLALFEGLFMTLEGYAERALNNGDVPSRQGNESLSHGPACAVYQSKDESLVAIDAHRDEWWIALCGIIGRSDLADDPRTSHYAARANHPEMIREAIGTWVGSQSAVQAEQAMVAAGVPASRVLTIQEMVELPLVKNRGMYSTVEHPEAGPVTITGTPYGGLTKTPGRVLSAPPVAHQHAAAILQRVLGYTNEEISTLESEGAFSV